MANYPYQGSVLDSFLKLRDQTLGRKFLNSPQGQAMLQEFQSTRTMPTGLAVEAAKRPEVASAVEGMGGAMTMKGNLDAQGLLSTAQGLLSTAQDNDFFSTLLDQAGRSMDPDMIQKVLQAGGATLKGPSGDMLRMLLQGSEQDKSLLDAIRGAQTNKPGSPGFIGPVKPGWLQQRAQELISSNLGTKNNPYFPFPQLQAGTDSVINFIRRLFQSKPGATPGGTPPEKRPEGYQYQWK